MILQPDRKSFSFSPVTSPSVQLLVLKVYVKVTMELVNTSFALRNKKEKAR